MPKKTIITFGAIIALGIISGVALAGIIDTAKSKKLPEAITASVIQAQKLAQAAATSEPKPTQPVPPINANPQNTSSAGNSNATYIICMPMITSPNSTVYATSSVYSATAVNKLPAQIQQVINSIPLPSGGSGSQTAVPEQNTSNTSNTPTPTPTSGSSQYMCEVDSYNCSDFTTQAEAQKVFDSCGGVSNDIHRLDGDHDGRVCTSLR
ncbi:excalibur calcium-binding domain-containing protein [Candidatus Parcubacteria bacterium]|nr:excalibur calcium-binding domain-containing protein [Candidatus Parcubacteria bacterium]